MPIPVRNIYYLLCYAWDRLHALDRCNVDAIPGDRVENLLGKVLCEGVSGLIRRGLDRGYIAEDEEGRRFRGRLRVAETMRRSLLPSGRVAYTADELSHDVPHNRIIKAAVRAMVELDSLDPSIRNRLREHRQRMHDVADVDFGPASFHSVQLHRNTAHYAFLIHIAQLIASCMLPDPISGEHRFHPFTANEKEMGRLFEAFVRNFLDREQDLFEVKAPKVPWDLADEDGSDRSWLPEMRTDVLLRSDDYRVVIETKYTVQPRQSFRGSDTLRSAHLYQLLTYLSQLSATEGPEPAGVLLYAGTAVPSLEYRLSGYRILVRSLDLDREWPAIHETLLGLVAELGNPVAAERRI